MIQLLGGLNGYVPDRLGAAIPTQDSRGAGLTREALLEWKDAANIHGATCNARQKLDMLRPREKIEA